MKTVKEKVSKFSTVPWGRLALTGNIRHRVHAVLDWKDLNHLSNQ